MDITPHVHVGALTALVAANRLTKQEIAAIAVMTPGQLSDLLSGRRPGKDADLRKRLARALGVDVSAITCPCPTHTKATA